MKPRIKRADSLLHLRYELPYHVHTANVYPLSAPNGSKIILCGHEQGLLILWRGGRPFKRKRQPNSQLRRNESSSGVISLDGSENPDAAESALAEFEDEEEEHDLSRPYADIIQHLDLPLGTAVLHLAFPRLPQLVKPESHPLEPALLTHKLVVALACADGSVRLLTLPLIPPSPALVSSKRLFDVPSLCTAGHGTWGEELVTLPGAHQTLPRGVAVAFAPYSVTRNEGEDSEDDMSDENEKAGCDVLLASHSADLLGMLLVHRIPVSEDGMTLDTSPARSILWRSRPLASPASSIDFYVSPSSSTSQTPRLLIAESRGPVRIFECNSPYFSDQGRWTFTLQPPTSSFRSSNLASVLDARWVMNGKAVAVLTAEGEWGIWDMALGSSNRTISGAKPTPFTLSGRIGNPIKSATNIKTSTTRPESRSQLAPMTPSTRKLRQEALFSNVESFSNRGGISVRLTSGSVLSAEGDEWLTIWHGDSIAMIPSLRTHWQSKFKGLSTLFTSGASGQIREVPTISHSAELRTSVCAFPSDDPASATTAKNFDILVSAERSLTISTTPLVENERLRSGAPLVPMVDALIRPRDRSNGEDEDQMMLDQGMLDIEGLGRLLADMDEAPPAGVWSSTPTERQRDGKRVGFR